MNRVAIFVDGANYYYMQKKLGWRIDAELLLEYIKSKTSGTMADAYYYVGRGIPPEARQEAYLNTISGFGYSIYTKDIKEIMQDDGTIVKKANLDIEIVLDMFNTIEHYDTAVLISGDGDFERPLELLRARGKKFLVLSTQGVVARELRNVAGMHYVDFKNIKELVEHINEKDKNPQ